MDASTKPRRRTGRGARGNVIAMPASKPPTKGHTVVPDLRALPGMQP
jgi:hypothetical protein